MVETLPFGSHEHFLFSLLLLLGRGMDLLSTRVATPNLVMEANPLARKLGWRWGTMLNLAICAVAGMWPVPALVVTTTSLLVAARNFKSAWWMRAAGEERYMEWTSEVVSRTSTRLYLGCIFGETILGGLIGGAIIYFSPKSEVVMAIGMGVVTYAVAVAFYSLLAWRRLRRKCR